MPKKNMKKEGGELTESEMNQILLSFQGSKYWDAYKMWISMRTVFAESALNSLDPFKQPTEMARNQGIRTGLNDLESHLIVLRKKIKDEEEKENREAK